MVDPALSLRPAAVPDAGPRPQLGLHDRRGHLRGADEREQAPGDALLDRLDADQRQPGGPRLHGRPRRAAAAPDDREPRAILGIEALCAAQGVEFRAPLTTSAPLAAVIARLRADGRRRSTRTATSPPTSRRRRELVRERRAGRGAAGDAARRGAAMTPVEVQQGDGPVILGLPHTGTWLPDGDPRAAERHAAGCSPTPTGTSTRLYDGLLPGATTVRATFHRYVIDANRGPDDASLYPGQNTTGLVPADRLRRPADLGRRPRARPRSPTGRRAFHAPYHAALAAEIARVKARHGVAILYDCHSIRSVIPFLFEGTLPDFNIGTNNGATCDPRVEAAALRRLPRGDRPHLRRERPLQGRLDHAPLRPARDRRPRDPDGAGAVDPPRRRGAALRLRRGQGRRAARTVARDPATPWPPWRRSSRKPA